MGFLDRLKDIRFKPEKRSEQDEEKQGPTLNQDDEGEWPNQIVRHLSLDRDFNKFVQKTEELSADLVDEAERFTDDKALEGIPDRARTMNALHAKEYAEKLEKLAQHATFTDLFDFEEDHQDFFDRLNEFRDRRKKNVSALKEYMQDRIETAELLVQGLEDTVVKFMQTLEEKQFPMILEMQDTLDRMNRVDEQTARYEQLVDELEDDLNKVQQKRKRFEEKMREQRALVRNQEALRALEKLSSIEEELDEIVRQYENTFRDAAKYYKRFPEQPPREAAQLLTDLPKDPAHNLVEKRREVQAALERLSEELEDKNVGNLHERLERLQENVLKDAARVREVLPEQKDLRKDIMKDVATLQIYDQQQFLLRAKRDEEETKSKLEFIRNQLESGTRTALEQELRTLAVRLGATVEGAPSSLTVDEEIEEAESSLEEEEDALDHAEEELDRDLHASKKEAEQSVQSAEELIQEVEEEMAREPETLEEEQEDVPEKEPDVYVGQPETSDEEPEETKTEQEQVRTHKEGPENEPEEADKEPEEALEKEPPSEDKAEKTPEETGTGPAKKALDMMMASAKDDDTKETPEDSTTGSDEDMKTDKTGGR